MVASPEYAQATLRSQVHAQEDMAMKWPWSRPEVRSSSYADTGYGSDDGECWSGASDGSALAALESAARIWGAGLSSATVKPENNLALRSVSPAVLDAAGGRSLCRVR